MPEQLKLTKNFDLFEFHCKDGTHVPDKYIPNAREVAKNLQVLRDEIGEPLWISGSGYRTVSYNKKVGGAKESQHLTASGADISAKTKTPKQLAGVIELLILQGKMKQGGIGVYPGFVHYDIRGTKARW
jgi:uncharacterized protein YcbK (DUF882 family)